MKKVENLEKSQLLMRYPGLSVCQQSILDSVNLMIDCFGAGGKLLVMGNGGSSADAEHICGELMKSFTTQRQLSSEDKQLLSEVDPELAEALQMGLPALSLGVAHSTLSAWQNDCEASTGFAQQIWVLANPNDVVLGISTSGNSQNVVKGLATAKAKGIKSILLCGEKKSRGSELADISIFAPALKTHHVQELHLPIYHALCLELEHYFFPDLN